MARVTLKERLHDYIDHADKKKIQAIYTLVENDLEDRTGLYDDDALAAFRETSKSYLSGKIEGYSLDESMKRVRKQIVKK